jgi:hypothetical protein
MKILIELVNCVHVGPFVIKVVIKNDGELDLSAPFKWLESVAELNAIDLRDFNGRQIDPVEYLMLNPKSHLMDEDVVSSGMSYSFLIEGKLVEKFGSLALVFPKATYVVHPGKVYSLTLRWSHIVSNAVKIIL